MSLMNEYIDQNLSIAEIEDALLDLIKEYNSKQDTYLIIYAVAFEKGDLPIALSKDDYFTIHDLLRGNNNDNLDFYIETPGGDGLAAEDIARFLRKKYENVNFVIVGDAKSAGTILVMSGDDILMSETGSLGPIDAQMQIGRSWGSAHDYMEWVNTKRTEAESTGYINPFDALMIAQISPIELENVNNNLEFAKEIVMEFLKNYKFKNWDFTETNNHEVTPAKKEETARQIAERLADHTHWRSHGRSLKIKDLENIGLRITNIDENTEVSEIVQRIHVLIRLLFSSSPAFKIFFTADNKLVRQAIPASSETEMDPTNKVPRNAKFNLNCGSCGEEKKLYVKFIDDPSIDEELQKEGYEPFPKNLEIKCACGFNIDLTPVKKDIEMQTGKSIILDEE
jgi:ATP-dependent protease ClpP protease subunit